MTNVHAESLIPEEDQRLFVLIQRLLSTFRLPPGVSCHTFARAVGTVCHLHHADGYFDEVYEHSWLVTPHGNIIDVYPIGVIGGPSSLMQSMDHGGICSCHPPVGRLRSTLTNCSP